MHITVRIDNDYADGVTVSHVETLDVPEIHPAPYALDDLDDWALEHIWPRAGSDRPDMPAAYTATIVTADAQPELVGKSFEWVG
jgi:hypothetical protein